MRDVLKLLKLGQMVAAAVTFVGAGPSLITWAAVIICAVLVIVVIFFCCVGVFGAGVRSVRALKVVELLVSRKSSDPPKGGEADSNL